MMLPAFLMRRTTRSDESNQPSGTAAPAAAAAASNPPPPAATSTATPAAAAAMPEQASHHSTAPMLLSPSRPSSFSSFTSSLPPSAPTTNSTALMLLPPSSPSISTSFTSSLPPSAPITKPAFNDDLWTHALSFLCYPDITHQAQRVSKSWRAMARSNEIWGPFCAARWAWMTATIGAGNPKRITTTTSTMAGQPSYSSSATEQPQQPQQQHQQQQQYHYYTLYTQRARARHRIRHPPPPRPFTHFDLAVNFRARQSSKTGKELVLYASRGRFTDDFPVNLFEFAGWTLKPDVVAKDEDLLFQNLTQAMTFFGPQGSCELDFTVVDRQNGRVAELASVIRAGETWDGAVTACSLGWDVNSTPQEEELWVIVVPEAVFCEGQLRVLRGVTIGVERVGGGEEGGRDAGGEEEGGGMIRCRVKSAWLCDHQHLNAVANPGTSELGRLEVARMFEKLQWV